MSQINFKINNDIYTVEQSKTTGKFRCFSAEEMTPKHYATEVEAIERAIAVRVVTNKHACEKLGLNFKEIVLENMEMPSSAEFKKYIAYYQKIAQTAD